MSKIKLKKRKELLSLLDFVFALGTPESTESFLYSFNENGGIMSVADATPTDEESAYKASRITTGTLDAQFFLSSNAKRKLDDEFLPAFVEKFGFELHKNLNASLENLPNISNGTLLFQCENKKFFTGYMGCGSVRLFLLTGEGLMILSPEEFSSVLTSKSLEISLPAILLLVSDRTFQKFDSPMDFEYTLLDTLSDSQTVEGWKSLLTKKILEEKEGSFQLVLSAFGFGTFKKMQKIFSNRKSNLYWNFLSKETNATPYEAEAMNLSYEQNYRSFYIKKTEEDTDETQM